MSGMRARLAAGALVVLALGGGGCTVGAGSGAVGGDIFFLGCKPPPGNENFGTPGSEQFFDLDPHFFAGEPFEDIGDRSTPQPTNLLTIRVQRNGNRIEVNDVLYFSIRNSYEVARCVRGRTINGVPDWDQRPTTSLFTEQPTSTPWCNWSGVFPALDGGTFDAGPDAGTGPRQAIIHLGTEEIINSSLALLSTCHQANVTGQAFDGWIVFDDFGDASSELDLPSDSRTKIPNDFKVNFGDRLRAHFEIILGDAAVVGAIKEIQPIPSPRIGGSLIGRFDFDLERGRAAQPFP
jgi:hypothetical protein